MIIKGIWEKCNDLGFIYIRAKATSLPDEFIENSI